MDNSYPSYIPPSHFQSQSSYSSQQQYSESYSPPPLPSQAQYQQQHYYAHQLPTHASNYPSYLPPQPHPHTTSPYKQHHFKQEQRDMQPVATSNAPKHAPGELEGVVVRTKFPVARIKRIVQADEDVGKVAQVTPVVVSKALELFMISIALRSADIARATGGKRVTAQHLKAVVQRDDQFDFLRDTVAKVADGPTAVGAATKGNAGKSGGGAKSEDSEDDFEEDATVAVVKRRKTRGAGTGKGRKRREDS